MSDWDWQQAAESIGVGPDGEFNMAAVAMHEERAIGWARTDGSLLWLSAAQVRSQVMQLAGRLRELGVQPGDRVAGILGKRPESFTAALATWYLGAVYVPLFTGFRGEGLRVRLEDSGATAIVIDADNRDLLDEASTYISDLRSIVVDEDGDLFGDIDLPAGDYSPAATHLDDVSTIMYTSGTTGKPKGCLIPHRAPLALLPFAVLHLGLERGGQIFSAADAGWAYGLLATGLTPMALGTSRIIYEGPYDAKRWWDVLVESGTHHLAAAPTAYRQLAASGADGVPDVFTTASSAGEPLDAATFEWFRKNIGVTIYDSYGLSEVGMLTGNMRTDDAPDPVPGSMGFAFPGYDLELRDEDGRTVAGEGTGRLAVRDNGYFLSSGYWNRMPEWEARIVDGWFVTEDLVRRDADGRYWYESRADDVIVASGMNVGPSEVESALLEHPLVDDAGCVGTPDPVKGTIVTAHVVLNSEAPDDLQQQLRAWVAERVGRHAAPRKVHTWDELPRTASGKLRRVELRQRATAGSAESDPPPGAATPTAPSA